MKRFLVFIALAGLFSHASIGADVSKERICKQTILSNRCPGHIRDLGGKSASDAPFIRAIVGEAANQPYQAMLGIACAIRNRGTLQGVYGLRNYGAQEAPRPVWLKAARAWKASQGRDVTGGCKFFGCRQDAPYFLNTLHFHAAAKFGDITFYRP